MNNIIHIYGPQGCGKNFLATKLAPGAVTMNWNHHTLNDIIGEAFQAMVESRSIVIDEVLIKQGKSELINWLLKIAIHHASRESQIILLGQAPLPSFYNALINSYYIIRSDPDSIQSIIDKIKTS